MYWLQDSLLELLFQGVIRGNRSRVDVWRFLLKFSFWDRLTVVISCLELLSLEELSVVEERVENVRVTDVAVVGEVSE